MSDKIEIKKLSLKKGDILVVKRSFNETRAHLESLLINAGKDSGIDFNVPIVFVDDVKDIAILRKVKS